MQKPFQIVAACIFLLFIHLSAHAAIPYSGMNNLVVEHDDAKIFSAQYTGFQKVSVRCLSPHPAFTILNVSIGRKQLSITLDNRRETFRLRTQAVRFSDQDKVDVEKMVAALTGYLNFHQASNYQLIGISRDILHYLSASSPDILSVQTFGLQREFIGQVTAR